ncbi:tail fiber protein [Pararheinheimera phage vB_PsoM_KLER1-1]|nr:tail fiber protein [Pararheinheimera phage vB_PsoM_KLER1-1]
MSTVSERLEAATVLAESASAIAKQWAEGPENTTIPTESGPLPTLAEFMRQNAANLAIAAEFPMSLAEPDSTDAVAGQQASKYFATFDTVAEMQALVTTAYVGRRVQWLGYHALSDGGSGWGVVKSGSYTANGGSIIGVGPSLYIEQNLSGEFQNIKKWGARGNVIVDSSFNMISGDNDTVSILNAIAYLTPNGGMLYAPAGLYLITETPYFPPGVSMFGDGRYNGVGLAQRGATTLFCSHTGPAMVSFKGSNGCGLWDLGLWGDRNAKPKTGLCMGRSALASAGHHVVGRISIQGWYTSAPMYSIASEENKIDDVFCWNFGGDAPYGVVTSTHDVFNIDGLVASTNIHSKFSNIILYVTSALSTSAAILLETSNDMGNIRFEQCYIVLEAGTYVRVNNGAIDGKAGFGPIVFDGVSGEPLAGGANPSIGMAVTSTVPVLVAGLTVKNCRFQLPANPGGDIFDFQQGDDVTLVVPDINIQPPEAFPYANSKIIRNKVFGGIVNVGRQYVWTDVTLEVGWSNEFGLPYAPAGYKVTSESKVQLRGDIVGGTGLIFTLPAGLRPTNNLIYHCGSGRVLVNVSGAVSLLDGAATTISLDSILIDLL